MQNHPILGNLTASTAAKPQGSCPGLHIPPEPVGPINDNRALYQALIDNFPTSNLFDWLPILVQKTNLAARHTLYPKMSKGPSAHAGAAFFYQLGNS